MTRLWVAALALAACDFAPPPPKPAPPPVAAKPVEKPAPPPVEKARPVEKPTSVSTELLHAIADGTMPASRFVDPKRHVVLYLVPKIDQKLCGDAAAQAATTYIKRMVEHDQAATPLTCYHGDDPAATRFLCQLPHAAEGDEDFSLVFARDPEFGLRIEAMFSYATATRPDDDIEKLGQEVEAPSACL